MGPLANPRRLDAMEGFVADAKKRGAEIRAGGGRHSNQGFFFAPTPHPPKVAAREGEGRGQDA
jgi:succinate-semialdehyde dehydrogenase/glutarate-semialdehyde dehydrogenase